MRFPVVFQSFGVLNSVLTAAFRHSNTSKVSVEMRDRVTGDLLEKVTFNRSEVTRISAGFRFKELDEKRLPTVDFDGTLSLTVEGRGELNIPSKLCNSIYNHNLGKHGLIHVNGLIGIVE